MATWLDDIEGVKDIVDATGGTDVPLARRPKLRFKGSFVVTDRPSDNLTEIDVTGLEDDITSAITAVQTTAEDHDTRHVRGAPDEIDGDLLDIDYSPSSYTKTVAPTSSHADHLASHLNGVDLALVNKATAWTIGSAISGNVTLAGADKFTIRITSGAGNHAISVSGDGRHAAGDMIGILHRGTGTPTIAGTGGMTVNKPSGVAASFFDQGSFVLVLIESSTVCHLIGRMTPS